MSSGFPQASKFKVALVAIPMFAVQFAVAYGIPFVVAGWAGFETGVLASLGALLYLQISDPLNEVLTQP